MKNKRSHCVNCGRNNVKLHKGTPICEECYQTCPLSKDDMRGLFFAFNKILETDPTFSMFGGEDAEEEGLEKNP